MLREISLVCVTAALAGCGRRSDSPSPPSASAPAAPSAEPAAVPLGALPKGPRVFVSNEGSGDVTVIDIATGKAIATFRVGKRPRGIQRSPDGSRVYVALSGSVAQPPGATGALPPADVSAHAIGVIDSAGLTVVDRLAAGSDPEQFALSTDGQKLYVANEDVATGSVLDLPGRRIEATLKVGEEPEGVAVSPDGRWVYVTCEATGTVEVVNAATEKIEKELTVGGRPRSAAFLPDMSKAYVTSEAGGTVSVVEVVDTIHVGERPWGIAITPEGRTLYVANGPSDDVSIIDAASRKETARVKVGTRPWGVVITP
jgi:YVTN family beta-propeller protein